jgi:hypothetical protein
MYAFLVLSMPIAVRQLQAKSKRAIGQVSVNQEDVASVRIPLPSLPEQAQVTEAILKERKLLSRLTDAAREARALVDARVAEVWGTA